MRTGLQLKMGQSLTMTPQLQQAIRLLQLSTLELQAEIQEALLSNPLLEEDDTPTVETLRRDSLYSAGTYTPDSQTDDLFEGETIETLQDHLRWQMRLSRFSAVDELIAETIIDAIDDHGYLTHDLSDLFTSIVAVAPDIEFDEVEVVLKRIQHFDPIGVGARNVQECLLLQLQHHALDSPYIEIAKRVVRDHLDLLGKRDYHKLARKSRLKEETLRGVVQLLQALEPRPGSRFGDIEQNYIIPDILVYKQQNQWRVELNPNALPKIRVNQRYADLVNDDCSQKDRKYIKQQLQDAHWLIKSIESRNETMLKVANCIVQRQKRFFDLGPQAMKPMILSDVAVSIDMHESTISRITNQKFMHTPQGIFELKYFFSSHVNTDDGGECSSTVIRTFIKKLIAEENAAKPLSDSKLAEKLAEQGIQVARRTIAKYRESLRIPASSQRKTLL